MLLKYRTSRSEGENNERLIVEQNAEEKAWQNSTNQK